jgi:hypothetical protein
MKRSLLFLSLILGLPAFAQWDWEPSGYFTNKFGVVSALPPLPPEIPNQFTASRSSSASYSTDTAAATPSGPLTPIQA